MRLSVTFSIIVLSFLSFVSSMPPPAFYEPLTPPSEMKVGHTFETQSPTSFGRGGARRVVIVYVGIPRDTESILIVYIPLYTSSFRNNRELDAHGFGDGNMDVPKSWRDKKGKLYSWYNSSDLVLEDPMSIKMENYDTTWKDEHVKTFIGLLREHKKDYGIMDIGKMLTQLQREELLEHIGEEFGIQVDPLLPGHPTTGGLLNHIGEDPSGHPPSPTFPLRRVDPSLERPTTPSSLKFSPPVIPVRRPPSRQGSFNFFQ